MFQCPLSKIKEAGQLGGRMGSVYDVYADGVMAEGHVP